MEESEELEIPAPSVEDVIEDDINDVNDKNSPFEYLQDPDGKGVIFEATRKGTDDGLEPPAVPGCLGDNNGLHVRLWSKNS